MSTLVPPSSSSGGGQHRQMQRSSRYYYDNSSSSNSSLSNVSFNLELNGPDQISPVPPPLPLRTHRVTPQQQQQQQRQRDSYYYCWSDGSGSTRLPVFPEEDNDNDNNSYVCPDNIRLQQYSARPTDIVRVNNQQQQQQQSNRATYQQQQRRHLGPSGARTVIYPSSHTNVGSAGLQQAAAASSSTTSASHSSVVSGNAATATAVAASPHSQQRQRRLQLASAADHAVVARGCGGRCETCENVCYYLLQVAFAMGLLIGSSLCIAGAALRRSPGRQLQVLLYIGALVALVSALLLVVQCRARRQANLRYHQQELIPVLLQPIQVVHPAQVAQSVPVNHKTIYSNNGTHAYQPQHKLLLTTMQRGVPVTLLQHQQVLYNPESSRVDGRNKETRILL